MNEIPPIIAKVPAPPLPAGAAPPHPAIYTGRCVVLCVVTGSLALAGAAGGIFGIAIGEEINAEVILYAGCYALLCYVAAVLLHRRRRAAYFAALPCFVILLPAIPLGTVVGILGLMWLHKAEFVRGGK